MKSTIQHDDRIASMTFALVYPLYVKKIEKKGKTVQELNEIIAWLTGFDDHEIEQLMKDKATFAEFFAQARVNPNASLITGVICGYRVEEITNPLTQQVRMLDKLVDELAKGRSMAKILRS